MANYAWADKDQTIIRTYIDDLYTCIPVDPTNTDYQAFLKWCEEGNEPEPYVAPEPPAPPTPEEKLAASGLTVEELKTLLGIQ